MKTPRSLRILVGILFIFFGAVLLMREAGVDIPFQIPSYILTWQMILILLGVYFLLSGNRSTGLIMLLVGGVFYVRHVLDIPFRDIIMVVIPALLILGGLFLLFPRLHGRKNKNWSTVTDTEPTLHAVHIFSGGSRIIQSESFAGGEVVCIFGGVDIHFKGSMLASGINTLDVTCIFGGCDIYVPEGWTVRLETTNLFGESSDKRLSEGEGSEEHPGKVFVIRGFVLFGGVEVKKA